MAATNAQVQAFVDTRVRPHCERARALVLMLDDDRASIDDVYGALNDKSTWIDERPNSTTPPHFLTPADVLGFNAFAEDVRTFMKNHGQYAVILKACVQPVQG